MSLAGKIVLVADDTPEVLDLITSFLRRLGLTVLSASNGADAVSVAFAQMPDLIIMDLQMPIMGGCEASRRIRSNPAFHHIPIIAFSGSIVGDLGEEALAAGCNECIQKPADLSLLREVIARYV